MPFYDFRCMNGHTFIQRVPMDSITTCHPQCAECGMESHRVFLEAPGVLMRPMGYNSMPGDKDYYRIPDDRHPHQPTRYKNIQSWQFSGNQKTATRDQRSLDRKSV